MNCVLTRNTFASDGIFGELHSDDGKFKCVTLEHSYATLDGTWVPKVKSGTYICKRHPPNRLPYETFELQNVPAFEGTPVSGILIHILNFDKESVGCIGVGKEIFTIGDGERMLTYSKVTFNEFMELQTGDEFTLTIKDTK